VITSALARLAAGVGEAVRAVAGDEDEAARGSGSIYRPAETGELASRRQNISSVAVVHVLMHGQPRRIGEFHHGELTERCSPDALMTTVLPWKPRQALMRPQHKPDITAHRFPASHAQSPAPRRPRKGRQRPGPDLARTLTGRPVARPHLPPSDEAATRLRAWPVILILPGR